MWAYPHRERVRESRDLSVSKLELQSAPMSVSDNFLFLFRVSSESNQSAGRTGGYFTDEPVEFEKYPVEVQDFRKITHRSFQRNLWNIPQITREKSKDVNMKSVGACKR